MEVARQGRGASVEADETEEFCKKGGEGSGADIEREVIERGHTVRGPRRCRRQLVMAVNLGPRPNIFKNDKRLPSGYLPVIESDSITVNQ